MEVRWGPTSPSPSSVLLHLSPALALTHPPLFLQPPCKCPHPHALSRQLQQGCPLCPQYGQTAKLPHPSLFLSHHIVFPWLLALCIYLCGTSQTLLEGAPPCCFFCWDFTVISTNFSCHFFLSLLYRQSSAWLEFASRTTYPRQV